MHWFDKWYIFLCCVLMLFEAFAYVRMKKRVEIELKYKNEEIQRLMKITELNKSCHEIVHNTFYYLKLIDQLAIENKNKEIIEIVESLTGKLAQKELYDYSNYKVLNTILCEYSEKAKQFKIKFDAYVEPGCVLWHISDVDIAIMLGNLLDNAVEAASKTEEATIAVRIFMHQNGEMCIIKIVNDYNEKLRMKEGKLLSTKEEGGGLHGIGIKSISKTAEQYKGFFSYYVEKGKFNAVLVLPIALATSRVSSGELLFSSYK